MTYDVTGCDEGGLPSRAERKRRRVHNAERQAPRPERKRRRVHNVERQAPRPERISVTGRPGRALSVLWWMIVLVGGAIVAVVELDWRTTGDPLQWYGAAAYVTALVLLLIGVAVRQRMRIRRSSDPVLEHSTTASVAPIAGVPAGPEGEEDGPSSDEVPLTFDHDKLIELRRAIAAAFPELATDEDDAGGGDSGPSLQETRGG